VVYVYLSGAGKIPVNSERQIRKQAVAAGVR